MSVEMANGSRADHQQGWKVTLVCPMFNEQEGIRDTVQRVRAALTPLCGAWEMVIVDDGSTDASAAIVDVCAQEDARIRLVRLHGHQGYGCVIRAGFAAARYELIAYTDADWPCDLAVLSRALLLLEDADVIAGYRIHRRENWIRTCYSIVYNALIRWLFGLQVRDVNFSFKVFTRRMLEHISLTSRGSFIDAESLIAADRAGFRIRQYPVDYLLRRYGQSTMSRVSVIVQIVWEMGAYWWKVRGRPRPHRATVCAELLRRYAGASWLQRLHLRGRWLTCPFETVESSLPRDGRVLDYGCGHGLFTHLLRLRSPRRVVTGYDPDVRKIRTAQASANGESGVVFTQDDPLLRLDSQYEGIALIDVLPYLTVEQGIALLRRCYAYLRPGGILVVKDIHDRPWWKFRLTSLQERLAVRVFGWTWAQGRRIALWRSERFQQVFSALGCEVERVDLSGGSVYPHVLWRVLKAVEPQDVSLTQAQRTPLLLSCT